MNFSKNAIDIIEGSEGLRLSAYIDPVGVPTIGYGTTVYPSGRRVQLGDTISDAEADAFLRFDCQKVAQGVDEATLGVGLNQNQFDALVSFSYNLGVGALRQSTLLRKLKAGDFVGAAAEFPSWNKGVVDGVRVELPGLTKRRALEQALFVRPDASGVPIPDVPLSDAEKVIAAKGFRQDGGNLLVLFDKTNNVIEILKLGDASPRTLIAALKVFPNLDTFDFAPSNDTVPAGTIVQFPGPSQPHPSNNAPPPPNQVLSLGSEDQEDSVVHDVQIMQTRLKELRYYAGPVNGVFDLLTDQAVKKFQADQFGASEADGLVGPKTWARLFGPPQAPTGDPGSSSPGKTYLKLTKTASKDEFGAFILDLAYYKDGVLKGSINTCSGQPRRQSFRTAPDSQMGSMEPLPEGKWSIGNIRWCGGKDNYSGPIWNGGLGPAKIPLTYVEPGTCAREAIEIHIDWNRQTSPGTAGCLAATNVPDFQKLVGWLRESNPNFLFVDWTDGTCPAP